MSVVHLFGLDVPHAEVARLDDDVLVGNLKHFVLRARK